MNAKPDAGRTIALDTPAIALPDGGVAEDACAATNAQAIDVLRKNCARCHGGANAGARQGQPPFDFVLDIDRLTSAVSGTVRDAAGKPVRFLVPGEPDHSRIYVRIAMGEMPPPDVIGLPANPRPSVSDLSVLREWITNCLGVMPSGAAGGAGGSSPTLSDPTGSNPTQQSPSDPGGANGAAGSNVQAMPDAGDSAGHAGSNGGSAADGGRTAGAAGTVAGTDAGTSREPRTPCSGLCDQPTRFSVPPNYQADLDNNASCHETTSTPSGWDCGNFDNRRLRINGSTADCGALPKPSQTSARNGGYCLQVSAVDRQNTSNHWTNSDGRPHLTVF